MTTQTELMTNPVFRNFYITDLKETFESGMFDDGCVRELLTPEEVRKYSTYDEDDEEWYFNLTVEQMIELMDTNQTVFDQFFLNYEVKDPYIDPDTNKLYPEYVEVFKLIDSYLN